MSAREMPRPCADTRVRSLTRALQPAAGTRYPRAKPSAVARKLRKVSTAYTLDGNRRPITTPTAIDSRLMDCDKRQAAISFD